MIIVWILNKNKSQSAGNDTDKVAFPKHDEQMRDFRSVHAPVESTSLPKGNGNKWFALAPVKSVKLAKYAFN